MKKFTVIVLALILVFAMSTTAFAATTGNSSDVKFTLDSSQISVTLPVGGITASAAATVTAEDTVTLTWPSADVTTITNNSAFPIKVDSIICSDVASGWTLASTDGDADDTIIATVQAEATGTAVGLLTDSQVCTGTQWNIAAVTASTHAIKLTLDGDIYNPDAATAAIASAGTKIFTVTFTVSAGTHS